MGIFRKIVTGVTMALAAFQFTQAQTYATLPYQDDFESGLGTEWTTTVPASANVITTGMGTPYEGLNHLLIDDGTAGGTNTKIAALHVNLSNGSEYTLSFFMKDFGDEDDLVDGIYFSDSASKAAIKVHSFTPSTITDNVWQEVVIDIDELAAANGLNLTDSFRIEFHESDDREWNNSTPGDPDGFAFDLMEIYPTPTMTSGSISGTDTICFDSTGTSTITLTEASPSLYGEGNIVYEWQSTSNLFTWDSVTTSSGTDTTWPAPLVTTLYRRCAITDQGQGPACSTPILITVTPEENAQILGLAASYANTDGAQTIFGSPIIGLFTGTGILDNADGTATLDVSSGGLGNRTITYTYTDPFGCPYTKDSVTNIILGNSVIYKPAPYTMDFESFPGWTGATEWRRDNTNPRVEVNADATPYEGAACLIMDDDNTGSTTEFTRSATLHVDLSLFSDYTLEFYMKDFQDEDHPEDGVFISTKTSGGFQKIFDFAPTTRADGAWAKYSIDLDVAAATVGTTLDDSVQIMFQEKDQFRFDESTTDGIALDSIVIFTSLPLTAGSINGSDTLCFATTDTGSVVITNSASPTNGEPPYSYTWESSQDLLSWSNVGSSSTPDTTIDAPSASTYYRRCVSTSSEGPICTSPIFIRVEQEPTVFLNIVDTALCENEPSALITGIPTSPDGTFNSYTGLTDNNNGTASLDPVVSGTGSFQTIYSYTNYFGCTASDTITMEVLGTPTVSFSGLSATSATTDPPQTLTGSPPGGVFEGLGVSGNAFYPAIAPTDTSFNITYTYSDANGCTNTSSPQTVVVTTGSSGAISSSLLNSYCADFPNEVEFKGTAPPGWSAVGFTLRSNGVASTNGFTPNGLDSAVFEPNLADLGTTIEIVFKYSQTYDCNPFPCNPYSCNPYICNPYQCNPYPCITGFTPIGLPIFGTCYSTCWNLCFKTCYNTCYNTCTRYDSTVVTTTVYDLPNVNFTNLSGQYCKNDAPFALEGNFSNTGFASSVPSALTGSTFDPGDLSIGSSVDLSYTFTDGNSCTNSDTVTVTIDSVPVVNFSGMTAVDSTCPNKAKNVFIGNIPSSGAFNTTTGLVNTTPGQAEFDPSTPSLPATTNIEYYYIDGNGCRGSITKQMKLHPLPVIQFFGLNPQRSYCVDATSVLLSGSESPQGTFFGEGIGVVDLGNGTANFIPSSYQADSSYTISYEYTDGNTCTDTASSTVYIRPLPTVEILGLPDYVCESDAPLSLNATPASGQVTTFSGPGVSGTTFTPANANVGTIDTIQYDYTEFGIIGVTACSNTAIDTIEIKALPVVTISSLDTAYCTDEPADTIFGTPANGTFSGASIIDFLDGSATISPIPLTERNTYEIIYKYSDGFGCTNWDTGYTYIDTLPVVSFTGLVNNVLTNSNYYCEDHAISNLVGSPAGAAGVFTSGSLGLIDDGGGNARFDPTLPVTNVWDTIRYRFTDGQTCTSFQDQLVYVQSLPVVDMLGLDSAYCSSDGPDPLSGVPGGGVFTGPGIVFNTFDPDPSIVGIDTIVYTFTDAQGCVNDTFDVTIVNALPAIQIDSLMAEYCEDDEVDTIYSNKIGETTGQFTPPSLISDQGDGTAIFDPSIIAQDSITITFTYTDTNSCVNSVDQDVVINRLPTVFFNGITDGQVLCADQSLPVLLIGNQAPLGEFLGDSLIEGIIDSTNGKAILRPDLGLEDTLLDITYAYMDAKGCVDTSTLQIMYRSLPVISYSGLDTVYCYDDAFSPLVVTSNQLGTTLFEGEGVAALTYNPALVETKNLLDPITRSYYDTVTLTFTNSDGCYTIDTQYTRVLDLPTASFGISGYCNNDTIYFSDSSTVSIYDSIVAWEWNYDNGDPVNDFIQNGQEWYENPGEYRIELTVYTHEGCTHTGIVDTVIGAPPIVDFAWDNICFGDTIQFSDSSMDVSVDTMVAWNWNFGDGNISNLQNPTHQYDSLLSYPVTLVVTTNHNCVDSLTRILDIRPVVNTFPYLEEFEQSNGGWFSFGSIAGVEDSTSWERAIAAGNYINDSATGNYSYVTEAAGNYALDEQSYVDGPCFDFSSLERPMIAFRKNAHLNVGQDGVNFQYSIDNGSTWHNVGSFDGDESSGINWFDDIAIAADPGGSDQGWSTNIDSGWVESRHDLDTLIGRSAVKLRFTFGSTPTTFPKEGFAFDSIWIGERSRLVLFEHFTSTADQNSAGVDDYVDNLVANNPGDVVDIQYHTAFDGLDDMNLRNQADPSARSLYYGVFSNGRGILDGNVFYDRSTQLSERDIKLRMLESADFEINITADINSGASINVHPEITSVNDIEEREITTHIVIVEKDVSQNTQTINGDQNFKSVMRQMLPDATGNKLLKPWTAGETTSFTQGWAFGNNVDDQSQLRVVVYVQDVATKEVLQTAYIDTIGISDNIAEDLNDYKFGFVVYPNPANGRASVLLSQPARVDMNMIIYDQFGKAVKSKQLYKGVNKFGFETHDLANGMYYVQIIEENQIVAVKKFNVQH